MVRRKGEERIRQGSVDEDIDRGFESDFFTNINSDTTLLKPHQTGFSTGALAEMQTTEEIQDSIAIYLLINVQNNYTTSYNAMDYGSIRIYGSVRHRFVWCSMANNDFRKAAENALGLGVGSFEEMFKNASVSCRNIYAGRGMVTSCLIKYLVLFKLLRGNVSRNLN